MAVQTALGIVCFCSPFLWPAANDYRMWLAIIVCVASAVAWAFHVRRFFAIHERPLSTVQAAAQGYIELEGITESRIALKSPIQGTPCVWYRHWVYAKSSRGIWQLQHYQTSQHRFGLRDATGVCEVDPHGAEVVASQRYTIRQHNHLYIEDTLAAGTKVYVLGELDSRHRPANDAEIWREANQIAIGWKQNPKAFKRRFDLNLDGQIDMYEWEHARKQAFEQVQRQYDPKHFSEHHIISKPRNPEHLFMISGRSPHVLRERYRFWSWLHGGIMCIFLVVSVALSNLIV